MDKIKNIVIFNEQIIESIGKNVSDQNKMYLHQDFRLLVNCYSQNGEEKPIILRGKYDCGKTTMAQQLANFIGYKAEVFDFSHSSLNGKKYMDQNYLFKELETKEQEGAFIIIKDLDQLDTYDNFLLMSYFLKIENKKNPKSTIIMVDNNTQKGYNAITDVIRRNSATLCVANDAVIDEIVKEEKAKKEAKQKKLKGVI